MKMTSPVLTTPEENAAAFCRQYSITQGELE
ncbi:hypothetical protein J2X42_002485 [Arthrobacter sp. BE255]|nr:hypothetical protein [Arthrobacter sp. BE255]